MLQHVIGIDIGGTKIAINLARIQNETVDLFAKEQFYTPQGEGYQSALNGMLDIAKKLVAQNGLTLKDICGIGISCGGPLDGKKGLILSPPNLVGWDAVPITEFFETATGIPTTLRNDADACACAEWQYGAGKGTESMIFLTFGTGFGAGLILNGQLYTGASGMAGEIGHCRSALDHTAPRISSVGYGKINAYEGYCSGGGIAQLGRMMVTEHLQRGEKVSFCPSMAELQSITAQSISIAANEGDPLALEIYRISGYHLGSSLAMLTDLLNPEMIVIGSIYVRSEHLLRDCALEVLEKESLRANYNAVRIVPAMLGEELGDVASVSVALSHQPKPMALFNAM